MKITVPTPHNSAKMGDIAKTVLMPGDPLRAEYIANKYLTNVICYNKVRGLLGFTGEYKGVKISVQGSGMGVPSMGIYSKELFEGYDVDTIIRIGSAGAISEDVNLRDILVASDVITDSNYPSINLGQDYLLKPDELLLNRLVEMNSKNKFNIRFGRICTSDVFYSKNDKLEALKVKDVLGVEMETAALYTNAKIAKKRAIAIFTVSDAPLRGEGLDASSRQNSFNEMMEIALELAIKNEE